MDGRKDARRSLEVSARLMLLTEDGINDREVAAGVADLSDSGCAVILPTPLPSGSAVRLDCADRMLLGEVVYSEPSPAGFRCGVKFRHALNSLEDLSALVEALLRAERPRTPEASHVKLKA